MALPNMAMIPSGYKPTKLYSVLPTPAVSDVELIANGDFATNSNWTKDTGWSISGGSLNYNGPASSTSNSRQLISSYSLSKLYEVTYTISVVSGGAYVSLGYGPLTTRTVSGTYTEQGYFNDSGTFNGYLRIYSSGASEFSISNISVKEFTVLDADFTVTRATPATRVNQQGLIETPNFIESGELVTNGDFSNGSVGWSVGSQWTVANGAASLVGDGNNNTLGYPLTLIQFRTYKVTFDVLAISGRGKIQMQSAISNEYSTTGSKVFYVYMANNPFPNADFSRRTGVVSMTITNISIVEVETEDIPRLDYTDGTCPVLLTEPQSTNFIPYSNGLNQGFFTKANTTITPNQDIAPSGLNEAWLVSAVGSSPRISSNGAFGSGNFSLSWFVKKKTSSYFKLRLYNGATNHDAIFDLENGTLTSGNGSIKSYVNGWYRCTLNYDTTAAHSAQAYVSDTSTGSIYMWGNQIEPLPYSTSIIPTSGIAATRNKDIVNNAGTSATYNSTEGVLFVEMATFADDDNSFRFISLNDGTPNNAVKFVFHFNTVYAETVVGGVNQGTTSYVFPSITSKNKIAFKYKENNFSFWVNGAEVGTDLVGSVLAANTLNNLSFDRGDSASPFYGKTSQVQVFNTALSDFDLQNLTSNATAYATYETMRTSLNFNIQ